MNEATLHKLTEGPAILFDVASELRHLAGAFVTTGNRKVAEQLHAVATDIGRARKMIEEGRNEALSQAVRASEEATGNMLRAAIAGLSVATGNPPAIKL
jgi:hypothetical protein